MSEEKLSQINYLTQNLQQLLFQKHAFSLELSEIDSALSELDSSNDEVYKIVGQMFIKSNKEKVKKEFEDKKKFIEIKLKSFDKQENEISQMIEKIRSEISSKDKK